jgi:hypothetical protein
MSPSLARLVAEKIGAFTLGRVLVRHILGVILGLDPGIHGELQQLYSLPKI